MRFLLFIPLLLCCFGQIFCRRHTLILSNDDRVGVLCSQFVYGTRGSLSVELSNLEFENLGKIGFSVERSTSNSLTLPSRPKYNGCPFDNIINNQLFFLRLGKKTAKFEGTTNPSLLFIAGSKPKLKPFVFVDADDEKTLKSFETHIAAFFVTYSDFSEVDAEILSIQIVKSIISDESLHRDIVESVKQSVDLEPAVYGALNYLLSWKAFEDDDENHDANVKLQRSQRKAPSVKQDEDQARNGDLQSNEPTKKPKKPKKKIVDDKMDANLIAPEDKISEAPRKEDVHAPAVVDAPDEAEIDEAKVDSHSVNKSVSTTKAKKGSHHHKKTAKNPPVEHDSAEFRLPATTLNAIKEVTLAYTSVHQNQHFPYVLAERKVFFNFTVIFTDSSVSGAYDLIFYNCRENPIDVTISMVERNVDNYLSLGEQPLAMLFFIFAVMYAILAVVWGFYLRFSKVPVLRMHHLMLAMVIVKSISLLFHAINYCVIGKHGVKEEGWAVMYYITHMIRGLLLFVTILMIGVGWTFVKHIFTRREKQVFLIVIPLQVVANIATIVINETEQGATRFALWKQIFLVVDLLCCAGVLFPVIWSIRHLRQAAQTDGKVAQNLRKLRLFRHFYVLVICYIYLTRIIVYLLQMTVPFAWSWLVELFEHIVTLIFYVGVGFKFRPFNDNPYLLLPTSEEQDMENEVMQRFNVEEAWLQSGVAEGVTRIHRPQGLDIARENRRRRDDALNQPTDAAAEDLDLLPLIRP